MSKFWALNGGNCQYKDFRFCGVLLENDGEQSKVKTDVWILLYGNYFQYVLLLCKQANSF